MRVLSNHYSTVNQRAIAMVNQWHHWKPLQRQSMAPLEAVATAILN